MEKNYTLDCYGLLCPMPVIKIAQMIKKIKKGEVLELISTDEGVKEDIPAWCRATGNEFLGIEEEKGIFKVYIKKMKD
ncbi:MAG: sulfurtransferase TusA family protein [bacterium]|nr:sulfurtransferase TusA family protein [bacterium]